MIELGKHIAYLLPNHHCVIVPGLGGFVTQYTSARYAKEEGILYPPYRSIGFNPQLTINDGLLVQSYMGLYETNYPEAMRLIEQDVAEIKLEMQQTGKHELHGIGSLRWLMNGSIGFEPHKAGIPTPEFYGLSTLNVSQQDQTNKENVTLQEEEDKEPRRRRFYTLRINREVVNYVAAAVISIFFYFLWAVPVSDGNILAEKGEAAFASSVPMIPKTVVSQNATPEAEIAQPAPVEALFTIVLASSIPLKNAEAYVAELHEKGMTDAAVMVKGKMIRVVYGSYAENSEAYTAVKKLHHDDAFSQAWVMSLK